MRNPALALARFSLQFHPSSHASLELLKSVLSPSFVTLPTPAKVQLLSSSSSPSSPSSPSSSSSLSSSSSSPSSSLSSSSPSSPSFPSSSSHYHLLNHHHRITLVHQPSYQSIPLQPFHPSTKTTSSTPPTYLHPTHLPPSHSPTTPPTHHPTHHHT